MSGPECMHSDCPTCFPKKGGSAAILVTKADLRLLVALANTVEDITEEEAAALNRARFRSDPS